MAESPRDMMRRAAGRAARTVLQRFGYTVVKPGADAWRPVPEDISPANVAIWHQVEPYTLTTPERVAALCDATRYVVDAGVPGAFVECGVWRGGSVMAVALTLLELGAVDRDLYLYDTFIGPPQPEARDVDRHGVSHLESWRRYQREGPSAAPAALAPLPLEAVTELVYGTGYPVERIHFVAGDVRTTIPETAPADIALLRLDTDYYASTVHELRHLEPRLVDGGVLIVDDYGDFKGAQDAVDEYYAEHGQVLLQRIDTSARLVLVNRQVWKAS